MACKSFLFLIARKKTLAKRMAALRVALGVLKPHFNGVSLTFQVLGGMIKLPVLGRWKRRIAKRIRKIVEAPVLEKSDGQISFQ